MEKKMENQTQATEHDTKCHSNDERDRRMQAQHSGGVWGDYVHSRGTRYETSRLSNFRVTCDLQRQAMESITKWIEDAESQFKAGRGVVLYGPCGTGKDHLITGMLHEAIKQRVFKFASNDKVKWEQGPRMFSIFRDAIGSHESETASRQPFVRSKLLILSDVCQSGHVLTDFQRQTLYDVVDRRYSFMRPTWVTTNAATRTELEKMLGADIADRLLHGSLTICCNWTSGRKP